MSADAEVVQDVDDAADRLYGAPSAGFTARRTELAGQARRAGLTAVSQEIAELRRPTLAAELVNLLVRAGEAQVVQQVDRLQTLGDQLRQAQAALDGDLMKQLTGQRHELVATLVRQTVELAAASGQKVSAAVQRELEETLGAAVADEQALLAVTSGRLTRALVYSGFGEVDISAATATPLHRPAASPATHRPATNRPAVNRRARLAPVDGGETAEARVTARAQAQAQAEAERVREAAETAQAAQAALSLAEAELAEAREHQQATHAHEDELANRLDELQRQILQTRHELDAASRKVAAADRDHQRQERQVRDARKAAWQAEQALTRISPTDS